MVKLVIFDFDGVIITGSNEGYFTCYHRALRAVGVRLDPSHERRQILAMWGKGYKLQLEHLLQKHPDLLPKAIKAYEECYHSPLFSKNIRLIKGADVALRELTKEYNLAISSGMIRNTMNNLLKKFNISFFKQIVTNEDITNDKDRKPAPFMIDKIMQDLSMNKKETVMVGDAENDVIMAKRAGVTPVVVLTGHLTKKEAENLKVKYVIPDITYLQEILVRI